MQQKGAVNTHTHTPHTEKRNPLLGTSLRVWFFAADHFTAHSTTALSLTRLLIVLITPLLTSLFTLLITVLLAVLLSTEHCTDHFTDHSTDHCTAAHCTDHLPAHSTVQINLFVVVGRQTQNEDNSERHDLHHNTSHHCSTHIVDVSWCQRRFILCPLFILISSSTHPLFISQSAMRRQSTSAESLHE